MHSTRGGPVDTALRVSHDPAGGVAGAAPRVSTVISPPVHPSTSCLSCRALPLALLAIHRPCGCARAPANGDLGTHRDDRAGYGGARPAQPCRSASSTPSSGPLAMGDIRRHGDARPRLHALRRVQLDLPRARAGASPGSARGALAPRRGARLLGTHRPRRRAGWAIGIPRSIASTNAASATSTGSAPRCRSPIRSTRRSSIGS
jgi:hypothetical protein